MRRARQVAMLFLATMLSVGCHFTTPDGRALDLGQYDSVRVEDVRLASEITEKQVGPLLEGYLQVAVLESNKWRLADDFDLDDFAARLEEYSTTAGTINGKPIEPLMTREQFLKEHSKAQEKWQAKLAEPKGTRPIGLRVVVTELRFPHTLEGVAIGTNPRMRCKVDVYADDTLLGSGNMEAVAGVPGVPLLPGSMVGRAAKKLIFDEFTRRTVLKLVAELAEETIAALEATK